MLAIGRALMNEPELLLIDEFTLGLAPTIVEILVDVVKKRLTNLELVFY